MSDVQLSSAAMAQALEIDTRQLIADTAERLFRQIGYNKTTVSDIAKVLRMSPANVYRFFDSKKAIVETVAARLMGEVEAAAIAIAQRPGPAADRLRELVATNNRMSTERFVGDEKLHEMVFMATAENWDCCVKHVTRINEITGMIVADGVAAGEFVVDDVTEATLCAVTAVIRFYNPVLIVQCAGFPGPTLPQMTEFVLAGLGHRGIARA